MPEEITSSVEAIEVEAEKVLADARTRANEILLQAREEAKKILAAQLDMDEVKAFSEKFVSRAQTEAGKKIEDAEKQADEISATADKKVKEITKLVTDIVIGGS